MLELAGVTVRYGMVQAVTDVTLKVTAGQIVSLIGANGAGKSTLLNAISGVVPLQSGHITMEGSAINGLRADRIVGHGVIQVPEGRQIFSRMTVHENLVVGAYSRRRDMKPSELDAVFDVFPRLGERRNQIAGLMSGGEQQMLAVGRAMLAKPRLLLLDEPSMGLAPLVVKSIFEVLKMLNKEGIAILLVEQNAKAALKLSDYTYVLTTGRITRNAPSAALLNDPEVAEAFLGRKVASASAERLVG